ncbi:MAG: molybdopterin-guanine dinucleotide biosynthesis protein B [Desulfobulbaceae bacterium]|uniref:Molybdopterin-guanine dinucleotide biosynthesis protein B n=1 Tax=Candidatus Desulfatifera sulfidica TaxID=2841691 RepID=A0A8J6TAP0_9BACT|nr:molybdopterin-guanine dinucleotide biosynthesis protein B [Candidatus Desulfatifera sulfidica]
MTPPIIGFIGWHDSGKTTLVSSVVRCLRDRGLRVGVIKSSKDQGIAFGAPDTDTAKHRRAGADPVVFIAPDQVVMLSDNHRLTFMETCSRYLDQVDVIIAEGFKDEPAIPKIEVFRGPDLAPLREKVPGVIAVASDTQIPVLPCLPLNNPQAVTEFIVDHLQTIPGHPGETLAQVTINGQHQEIPLKMQAETTRYLSRLSASLQQPFDPQAITIQIQTKKE